MARNLIRGSQLMGLALLSVAVVPASEATQVGGLIKKATKEAERVAALTPPPTFDAVTLELTQAQLGKVIAGMRAGKEIAEGPNGPAAIRAKVEAVDARQAAIYEKHVNEINAWDGKRMDVERCRDSAFAEIMDRISRSSGPTGSDPRARSRTMELALAAAEAKLRADSAAVRRVMAELERLREPTKSDTAQVMTLCGQAAPPGLVKEWLDLKAQLEELQRLEREAQAAVRQAETSASGMTDRQLAVACERIKQFVDQSRRKAAKGGFTAGESQALAQAIKDLEDLCP